MSLTPSLLLSHSQRGSATALYTDIDATTLMMQSPKALSVDDTDLSQHFPSPTTSSNTVNEYESPTVPASPSTPPPYDTFIKTHTTNDYRESKASKHDWRRQGKKKSLCLTSFRAAETSSHCCRYPITWRHRLQTGSLTKNVYICLLSNITCKPRFSEGSRTYESGYVRSFMRNGKLQFRNANSLYSSNSGLQIRVIGAPGKSRVETQIRLCIQLLTADGTKVPSWSYIKLPDRLLARSRLKKAVQKVSVEGGQMMLSNESKLLHLDAKVVCASKPNHCVKMCDGCIQREVS